MRGLVLLITVAVAFNGLLPSLAWATNATANTQANTKKVAKKTTATTQKNRAAKSNVKPAVKPVVKQTKPAVKQAKPVVKKATATTQPDTPSSNAKPANTTAKAVSTPPTSKAIADGSVTNSHSIGAIAVPTAEVFEGPNANTPVAILSRFTPVKVLTHTGGYSKIVDAWGKLGWVKSETINTNERFVLAGKPVTSIVSAPDSATVVFEVAKDVALKVLKAENGWLKVEHYSGKMGFVPMASVVGYHLNP